jgi:hypothetical protein
MVNIRRAAREEATLRLEAQLLASLRRVWRCQAYAARRATRVGVLHPQQMPQNLARAVELGEEDVGHRDLHMDKVDPMGGQ